MNRINKYLIQQLVGATLLVAFVMTGVIWLFIAVRAVEHIVNRGVSVKIFMYLSMLQIPNFIVHIIPFSIFIATLFVYSRLNSDRELVVLRAAGMSPFSLAKPAILVACFATLIGYSLTLYGTPKSYQSFRNLQWDIRYNYAHVLLKEGVFNTISDSITVFIRERSGESELRGILYHDTRNKDKPVCPLMLTVSGRPLRSCRRELTPRLVYVLPRTLRVNGYRLARRCFAPAPRC